MSHLLSIAARRRGRTTASVGLKRSQKYQLDESSEGPCSQTENTSYLLAFANHFDKLLVVRVPAVAQFPGLSSGLTDVARREEEARRGSIALL
jgi:hypothetical protein